MSGPAGDSTIAACPCVSPSDVASGGAANADQITTFISDYKAKFGEDPGIYALEGWDIAQIYIAAFKAGKTDRAGITDFVRNVINFPGLAKTYSWEPDGELFPADRTMYLYSTRDRFGPSEHEPLPPFDLTVEAGTIVEWYVESGRHVIESPALLGETMAQALGK